MTPNPLGHHGLPDLPVQGVPVESYNGSTSYATVSTNVDGEAYFSNLDCTHQWGADIWGFDPSFPSGYYINWPANFDWRDQMWFWSAQNGTSTPTVQRVIHVSPAFTIFLR